MSQKVRTGENGIGWQYQKAVSSLCLEGLSGQHPGKEAAEGIPLFKREMAGEAQYPNAVGSVSAGDGNL